MVLRPENEPVLTGEGLSFAYGRTSVLRGVDVELVPGRILGIIGPNGSGKSTLLGLLAGLLTPVSGDIFLKGRNLREYSRLEIAERLGLVTQTPELAPGFTVLETVLSGRFARMGRRLFEDEDDRRAARMALDATGLSDLGGRPAGELSGGEKQRLSLARVLAAEPGILLLDEPTNALDLDHQLKIMKLLEKQAEKGRTAVCLVSHDLNLAALFCHRLLLLGQGRTLAVGPPEEVLLPHTIRQAYHIDVLVDRDPVRKRPRISLVPEGLGS